jgi:uncharacterized protein (AIM24 family)
MKNIFVILMILISINCYSQIQLKLDSLVYSFVKKSLANKGKLYVLKDSLIFSKEKNAFNVVSSKVILSEKRKNKTYIMYLTDGKKIDLEGINYLEFSYNIQQYKHTHKKIQIWKDEGLYRFKVQFNSLGNPVKLEFTNGISPLNLTP